MKVRVLVVAVVSLLMFSAIAHAQLRVASIEGFIYDENRVPVYNAYVELYDEIDRMIDRQRSTNSGRYIFRGMENGRYVVVVKPFGTNLLGESQSVVVTDPRLGNNNVFLDFRLRVDKRFVVKKPVLVGTVFAQDVPAEARDQYKLSLEDIDAKRNDKGMSELQKAIEIFPTYFDALTALGKMHVILKNYDKGYPLLIRAVDINRKCPDCFYSLGLAFYKLKEYPSAVLSAEAATQLQPQSPEYHFLLGMALRLKADDLPRAEKELLAAKSLFKEPDPDIYMELSLLYNKMDRNEDAAKALESYVKAMPDLSKEEKQGYKETIDKLRNAKSK